MSGRRFRDASQKSVDYTEAELAHQNLVAINADLQRQVAMLEKSTSFRLGRAILRILHPAFVLFRIKRFANRTPTIVIDNVWPRLEGSVTIHQPTSELIPVRVDSSIEELLNEAIDPKLLLESSPSGPWHGRFAFDYPLGFSPFDSTHLVARVGRTEAKGVPFDRVGADVNRLCRPIEIAVGSIIDVSGDPMDVRKRLRDGGAVAVLSTYRNSERITAVPRRLIGELRAEGFLVVVVDTSASLPDEPFEWDLLIHRRNVGWDFASWMSTLAMFPWLMDDANRLLLVNDSNVGPLRSLSGLFEQGSALDADIWGITDSWDIQYHLQSYFLHFGEPALRSGHLHKFVESFSFPSVKERIIGSGEIGLSQYMIDRGLRLGAVFPYTKLAQTFVESFHDRVQRVLDLPENRLQSDLGLLEDNDEMNFLLDTMERLRNSSPVNPTHYFWDILLAGGCPFIKRDLLTKNPDLISGLHRLTDLLPDRQARSVLDEEMQTWARTHPDLSLPLAFHRESDIE